MGSDSPLCFQITSSQVSEIADNTLCNVFTVMSSEHMFDSWLEAVVYSLKTSELINQLGSYGVRLQLCFACFAWFLKCRLGGAYPFAYYIL